MPLIMQLFFFIFISLALFILLRALWIVSRMDAYLKETKKGKAMVERHGYEKSVRLLKTVAIPIAIVGALFFVGVGIGMYIFIDGLIASGQLQAV